MLSKNNIKLIKSLEHKKYRNQHQLFVVEGVKNVQEFLNSRFELSHLFTTDTTFLIKDAQKISYITEDELKKISFLKTPNTQLALFKIPVNKIVSKEKLLVGLDAINDPGNLGTIIRLCDWFGIEQLICSEDTVDCYNQKVVQATMGSLTRVKITYTDLKEFLKSYQNSIYGTFMDGASIYNADLYQNGIIIMGNEANGISKEIEELISEKLSIPTFRAIQETESLNVATATAIVLSEFKRRLLLKS